MFSQSQHPDLPPGTTLTLLGSVVWAPTTAGQSNTAMDFVSTWKEVILDSHLPVGLPGGNFISHGFGPMWRKMRRWKR